MNPMQLIGVTNLSGDMSYDLMNYEANQGENFVIIFFFNFYIFFNIKIIKQKLRICLIVLLRRFTINMLVTIYFILIRLYLVKFRNYFQS